MPDRLLQRPFADIIVQRGPRHAQKQRPLLPMPNEIRHRLAQPGVGLDASLVELSDKPGLKLLHDRAAAELMEEQALVAR